ncbi:DUF4129 domain-containing protein [Kroppenstedtia eburnea]|uniref:Protein-glutamine gamma-glutamyltransferase-like C-terminal domain-containing protein n=1 Tax=Kroppenstedtia eburnea TaxID=714067 RepID=A0A1N7ISM1_9BACL|nr:DUF4129 domain-containing protein [Kroppenstedtia eburnea]EGK13789.1 hypothetical protein HMPREF9374_0604 [Desmospora sp. 8437]QKI82158.1 DUF4129 domain-containing protein [Kroppenstedtia eburnea]SIS40082.1 protein of unknown function [Kroppenstedtia eburnea]
MSSEYREVRRQLAEILKDEESARGGWLVDLQNQLVTWFDKWDGMFREWLVNLFGIPIPVGWGWLLPVLIILILLFTFFWIRRGVHYTRHREGDAGSASMPAGEEVHRWWREGEMKAEQGDYREGIRCLFRAVLAALEERKVLIRGDHKTNREYRQEVEQNGSGLLSLFSALTLRFDLVRYGRLQAGEGDYREFRRLSAPLVEGGDRE